MSSETAMRLIEKPICERQDLQPISCATSRAIPRLVAAPYPTKHPHSKSKSCAISGHME